MMKEFYLCCNLYNFYEFIALKCRCSIIYIHCMCLFFSTRATNCFHINIFVHVFPYVNKWYMLYLVYPHLNLSVHFHPNDNLTNLTVSFSLRYRDFIQATRDDIEALHSRTVDQTTTSQVRTETLGSTSNGKNTLTPIKHTANIT